MTIRVVQCLAFAAAMGLAAADADASEYPNAALLMTPSELASMTMDVAEGRVVILDVRPEKVFREGHLPGATHIAPDAVADPESPVEGALRPLDEVARMLGARGIAADTHVVLYDDRGGFHAARMFWLLEYLGHRKVSLLDGGLPAWTTDGRLLATGDGDPVIARRFVPAVAPRRHASADYILKMRNDPETVVVDVRPEGVFAKGHIPWARNVPWKQNLDADATMRSTADLAAHFAAHGITPDRNVVVHCENGLASAHTYVALRLMGYPRVRTYHRSWSEWGAADDLPKAVRSRG